MNAPAPSVPPLPFRPAPSLPRAFGGIWRLTLPRFFTVGHGLALAGALTLLGLIAFAFISGRNHPSKYLDWVINFYVTFLVPIVSFITAAGTIRDDMKSSTVDYVLTRPVPRPAFVAFRYLSHMAASQVEFLLAAAVVVGVGVLRQAPDILSAIPLLLLGQFLLVIAFSAFGFLCGAITARYFVIGVIYGAVVELGVGQIPTQLNRLSMTHQVKAMLQPLMPAFDTVAKNGDVVQAAGVGATLAIVLTFTLVMLFVAAALFTLRELSGATES